MLELQQQVLGAPLDRRRSAGRRAVAGRCVIDRPAQAAIVDAQLPDALTGQRALDAAARGLDLG